MTEQPKEPEPIKCPTCQGSGKVYNPDHGNCDTPWETCERCQGTGRLQ